VSTFDTNGGRTPGDAQKKGKTRHGLRKRVPIGRVERGVRRAEVQKPVSLFYVKKEGKRTNKGKK